MLWALKYFVAVNTLNIITMYLWLLYITGALKEGCNIFNRIFTFCSHATFESLKHVKKVKYENFSR